MFKGEYNGKSKHQADLDSVLDRATKHGLSKVIITAGDLETLKQSIDLIESYKAQSKFPGLLYTTCGVHPTMGMEFEKDGQTPDALIDTLIATAQKHKEYIVAVGEFGLDYDRLQFCDKERQMRYFELQFKICDALALPLFLHMRECASDFCEIIKRNRHRFASGVAHSFTGTAEEARQILDLDLYIGINGCSLKTQENLEVLKTIPVERLMIETDAPWCEIRPTHAGSKNVKTVFPAVKREKWSASACVKGRNEPCHIVNVLEVIAAIKEMEVSKLAEIVFLNSQRVFFPRLAQTTDASSSC
jgi:TatD DNase family protein